VLDITPPSSEIYNPLAYRDCERWIQQQHGKKPLSASFDKLGNGATLAMALCQSLRTEGYQLLPQDGDDAARAIIEVYPAIVKQQAKREAPAIAVLDQLIPSGIEAGTDQYDAALCALLAAVKAGAGAHLGLPDLVGLQPGFTPEEGWVYSLAADYVRQQRSAAEQQHSVTRSLRSIYQLKVTLQGCRPLIWRRLRVSSAMTLAGFHQVIQTGMGWHNHHLYLFLNGTEQYGQPGNEGLVDCLDAAEFRLDQLFREEKQEVQYIYDFGDNWTHSIVLEQVMPFKVNTRLPMCTAGARACPPEDVGGVPGYFYFLEAIAHSSHPEYHEQVEWIGGDFDPEHFDVEEVNYRLLRHAL